MDSAGRILIPLKQRRELGLTEGSELILRVDNGELRMHTREDAIRRARERLKRLKKPGVSVVDGEQAARSIKRGQSSRSKEKVACLGVMSCLVIGCGSIN